MVVRDRGKIELVSDMGVERAMHQSMVFVFSYFTSQIDIAMKTESIFTWHKWSLISATLNVKIVGTDAQSSEALSVCWSLYVRQIFSRPKFFLITW